MEHVTLVSGLKASKLDKDEVNRSGRTDLCTRDTGSIIKHMARADLFTQMATFTMASGLKIRLMALACTHT
jgi:hypothetical protein